MLVTQLNIMAFAVAATATAHGGVVAKEATAEAGALATVEALLAAVSARDGPAGLAYLRPEGTATVIMERADGTRAPRSFALARYADATVGPERFQERMINPFVSVHDGIALVWGRYTFAINGNVRHCGFQQFGLVNDGGRWLVQNVTWSVRTAGCA